MKAKRVVMAVMGSVVLLAWALPAQAASPQPGSFSGGTSQPGGAVTFTVPARGDELLNFGARMVATCEKADAPTVVGPVKLTPAPSIAIVAGAFDFSDEFSLGRGSQSVGHGKGEVHGSFTSDRVASGSMRFPWEVTTGPLLGYHCDTGVVTFRATAPQAPALPGSSQAECVVPALKGKGLKAAKRAILASGCGVGEVRHRQARRFAAGRVMRQWPHPEARRGAAAAIKVVLSSGPPHRR